MSFDYTRLSATALLMLDRFGVEASIKRDLVGDYDEELGSAPTTTVEWTAKAVRGDPYSAKEIDGTLIQSGDLRLYVSADAAHTLETGDRITIESEVWRIERPNPVRPAATTLLYTAQVRK